MSLCKLSMILGSIIIVVLIAAGVTLGVVLGTRQPDVKTVPVTTPANASITATTEARPPPTEARLENLAVFAEGRVAQLTSFFGFDLVIRLAEASSGAVKDIRTGDASLVIDYEDGCQLRVLLSKLSSTDGMQVQSYRFEWKKPDSLNYLRDTLLLGDIASAQWYGGAIVLDEVWPMNNQTGYSMTPFVTGDAYQVPSSGQERYWLNSKRIALIVPPSVHLWTQNINGYLSLQAQTADSPYTGFPADLATDPYLVYEVLVATTNVSLAQFHQFCAQLYLGGPTSTPDKLVVEKPVWTTWAEYGRDVSQTKVE
ncbi:hypothetical protein AAVH_35766, partial [Aphelenchoides avenae]